MRRHPLLLPVFCRLAALLIAACFTPTSSLADEPTQPNIILVMTDDQGYGDLSCHGHPFLKTPNIDKLFSQSTRFTDFHVSATCSPTRAALMSGRAAFKNGVTRLWPTNDQVTIDFAIAGQAFGQLLHVNINEQMLGLDQVCFNLFRNT